MDKLTTPTTFLVTDTTGHAGYFKLGLDTEWSEFLGWFSSFWDGVLGLPTRICLSRVYDDLQSGSTPSTRTLEWLGLTVEPLENPLEAKATEEMRTLKEMGLSASFRVVDDRARIWDLGEFFGFRIGVRRTKNGYSVIEYDVENGELTHYVVRSDFSNLEDAATYGARVFSNQ